MLEPASPLVFLSVVLLIVSAVVGVVQIFVRRATDVGSLEIRSVADTLATLTAATSFLGTASLIIELIVSPIYLKVALIALASVTAVIALLASFIYIGIARSRARSRP